jgi:hypothetical protein
MTSFPDEEEIYSQKGQTLDILFPGLNQAAILIISGILEESSSKQHPTRVSQNEMINKAMTRIIYPIMCMLQGIIWFTIYVWDIALL